MLRVSGESAVLSFVNWLTLSGAEQSGLRGPSTENQEAKQAAILCIKVKLMLKALSLPLNSFKVCTVYLKKFEYPELMIGKVSFMAYL